MTTDAFLFSIWLLYVVIKDVVKPLVEYVVKRKNQAVPEEQTVAEFKIGDAKAKFAVLELDLTTVKTQIVDFKDLLKRHRDEQEQSAVHLDEKMDMVLAELKTLSNRITAVEVHIRYLTGRTHPLPAEGT